MTNSDTAPSERSQRKVEAFAYAGRLRQLLKLSGAKILNELMVQYLKPQKRGVKSTTVLPFEPLCYAYNRRCLLNTLTLTLAL